jgi:TonB family protein
VVGVEDPDFTFTWYIDRLAAAITENWVRPPGTGDVKAVFHFRILRDGTVSELELRESSASDAFDAAARRAILASSPLPPLPRGYKPEYLGINLVVR